MQWVCAILGAIWLCVLCSIPKRPAFIHNEVAWLVYSRQYGAWQRLFIMAILATVIGIFLGLCVVIHEANSDLFRLRSLCAPGVAVTVTINREREVCWSLDDDGTWRPRSIAS